MTVSDVSVRAALAVGLSSVSSYAVITGTPLPEWFVTLTISSVSFYFGGKAVEQNASIFGRRS